MGTPKLPPGRLLMAATLALWTFTSTAQTPQKQGALEVTITGRAIGKVEVRERTSSSFFMRVRDAAGKDVQGITRKNVSLRKDGERVRVTSVTPLRRTAFVTKAVVLVLDNSTSMEKSVDVLLQSVQAFLDTLGPGAEVAVVTFEESTDWLKDHPVTSAGWDLNLAVLDFTTDYTQVMHRASTWFKSRRTNSTYLRDASLYGLDLLAGTPVSMQKFLVIMSDGDDVGSRFTLDQVLQRYSSDVRIYMIDFASEPAADQPRTNKSLEKIREATGGNWYLAKDTKDLTSAFGAISRDLSVSYLVEYKAGRSVESHVLNYVFFDENSSQMRPRYKLYTDPREALVFDEAGAADQMEQYYNTLNIVGSRMRMYPSAKVTLTGCNSGEGSEKGNSTLSRSRAETVQKYLTSVWRVDPGRIVVEARDLPAKPSTSGTEAGREENRRVEITSDTPELLKPVLTNKLTGEIVDERNVVEIYSLELFDFDSPEVSVLNRAMLGDIAATCKAVSGEKVKAVGYTDNIGDRSYNAKLAMERAKNAADILAKNGVPRGSISSVSLGQDEPSFDNATPEGRFFNRTVRVYVTYPRN
jgi:VWFA-related protein